MQTVAQLIDELKRLASDFDQLSVHQGENAFMHWHELRVIGDKLLNDLWTLGALHNLQVMNGIQEKINAGRGNLIRFFPFDSFVGFSLNPKQFENDERTGWYLDSGELNQPSIAFDYRFLVDRQKTDGSCDYVVGDLHSAYKHYGFTLCKRCARGCRMLVEIIEHEMATGGQTHGDLAPSYKANLPTRPDEQQSKVADAEKPTKRPGRKPKTWTSLEKDIHDLKEKGKTPLEIRDSLKSRYHDLTKQEVDKIINDLRKRIKRGNGPK